MPDIACLYLAALQASFPRSWSIVDNIFSSIAELSANMNRFRTRRKAAKEEAAAKLNGDPEPSMPFRLFNKGKKTHEEPPKEIDISTALPSTDDFRTSLLMTGLSARFSMLREQDDPNTKIGKASDDSVLQPKRQSRILDMSFGGLGDIAEVESVRAPPSLNRMDSYNSSSDADSTNPGSVMSRSRPTEGNVLFGGRQKIYKVGTTASGSSGGLGKPLYEDDVSLSSFQRWRQAEKEKQLHDDRDEENTPSSRTSEADALRPESPPSSNRKRETGSTTSSGPSASRISTAATSVTSQKDGHSSTTSPPLMEKSTVARTRRLYEQGLTQDLQHQQSHALSRIDTLTRRGPPRSTDASQSTSPTGHQFGERTMDRKLHSKASAPNMQTSSPFKVPRSVTSPVDLGLRVSGSSDTKPFGGAPPLSPPISESEDSPVLPIHPSDRGKATALGFFNKPSKPYDESRFAQRQIALQQGRETPTLTSLPGSAASPEPAEVSTVSNPSERPSIESTAKHNGPSMTSRDGDEEDAAPKMPPTRMPTRQPGHVRPADEDHPAFRSSALPTPLSFNSQVSDDAQTQVTTPNSTDVPRPSDSKDSPTLAKDSPILAKESPILAKESPILAKDSPTLGPPAGLSGLVRQHLRTNSGSSSVYGTDQPPAPGSNRPVSTFNSQKLDDLVADLNPWAAQDQEWRASFYPEPAKNPAGRDNNTESPALKPPEPHVPPAQTDTSRQSTASSDTGKERDVFHSQLADGARRVRERLTTYVEADSNSRDPSSTPDGTPRTSPLGSLLRKQSSRGSLDKHRDANSGSKAMKMLGLNNATMSSSSSPNRQSFEEKDHPLSPMQEEPPTPEREPPRKTSSEQEKEEGGGVHAGVRQFRQARRELQKLKEAETRQRHQNSRSNGSESPNGGSPASRGPTRPQVRSPSRERRPPPVSYSRPPSTEPWAGPGSNPGSRAGSRAGSRPPSRNDRDRSGSEASNSGKTQSRPSPRLRRGTGPEEYQHGPQHSPYAPPHRQPPHGYPQGPMMKSPGLPGTDVRRPPMFQGMPSPAGHPDKPGMQAPGLSPYQQQRGMMSGQPSPISPMGDLPSPYSTSGRDSPNGGPPSRRPSQPPAPGPEVGKGTARLDESMKRVVRKQDISEPTFVSSTSRVPTVNLPEEETRSRSGSGSRSRSGSLLRGGQLTASSPNLRSAQQNQTDAPPVPPINPRRRNVLGNLKGGKDEDDSSVGMPQMPFASEGIEENRNSAFSVSDEEDTRERRKLRKATSEANVGSRARSGTQRQSPPYYSGAAPAVKDNGMPGGLI